MECRRYPDPELAGCARQIVADGAEPSPDTPEQFAQFISRELAKYARIIKASGAKVD